MSAISTKYAQLGGAAGLLGAPAGPETACPDGDGRFRHYAGGSIYWHPAAGAHEVHGAIRDRWGALGWELSWLGYPTSDETDAPGGGKRSLFQHGRVDWSAATGAVDSDGVRFATYTGRDHAGHQDEYDRLRPLGYRPLSLNMYGSAADPHYAAVWVKRGGPDWAAAHGRTAAQLQQWADEKAAEGLFPTLVAALGAGSSARFALAVERFPDARPVWRIGLRSGPVGDPGTLQHWCHWARANHHALVSIATYGDAASPAYAAVWHPDPSATGWTPHAAAVPAVTDAAIFQVQMAHGARPYLIERGVPSDHVLSAYRDDAIGPWVASGGLSPDEFQQAFDARAAEGYFPRALAGSGTGSGTRFNVLFTKREHPLPCRFVATGTDVGAMRAFDEAVEGYMRRNDIRGGTLAVARNGRLALARGYTWGPPTYPITRPTTLLRIGSISKTLTNILIHQLTERVDGFTLDSGVQQVLALTPPPNMSVGSVGFDRITVGQCLAHRSGVRSNFADLDLETVQAFGGALPATSKRELAAMLMTKPREFAPGAEERYSNSGYLLLGAVVEHLAGRPWASVLRTHVLNPLGVMRPRVSGSLLAQRVPGEALYHDADLALVNSVMTPDRPLVRTAYGDPNLAVGDAVGGMAFGAADLVKLYSAFLPAVTTNVLSRATIDTAMWGMPAPGWMTGTLPGGGAWVGHNGGLANMQSFAFARTDGVVFAVAFNKGANEFEPPPLWHDLVDSVRSWPAVDLFPSVDIPAFG